MKISPQMGVGLMGASAGFMATFAEIHAKTQGIALPAFAGAFGALSLGVTQFDAKFIPTAVFGGLAGVITVAVLKRLLDTFPHVNPVDLTLASLVVGAGAGVSMHQLMPTELRLLKGAKGSC